MTNSLNSAVLNRIFLAARSHNGWLDRSVEDEQLKELYSLFSQGPTSNNGCPARIVFVRSEEGKARLMPSLKGHNGDKVSKAPVTAIVAYDTRFFEFFPQLFAAYDAGAPFRDNPQAAEISALRNSSLQGAYLIVAARALGLDCGPMSGFDNAAVDAEFFPDGRWKSNFLCAIGYGDSAALRPKGSRLHFDQACQLA